MQTEDSVQPAEGPAQPYEPPAVVYESDLEVRAGTQLGIPDPLDLTGAGKQVAEQPHSAGLQQNAGGFHTELPASAIA